jgi:bifunctional non-homologous end joining protein LigD
MEHKPIFVVHKHYARTLHYDFRLEIDGVLKSWAVPKGPSMDPADKRLAIMVDDHDLSFADFEGTIPEGQYGAGKIEIWDKGCWEFIPDTRAKINRPLDALTNGRLRFATYGTKLTGKWLLARGTRSVKDWLLMKMGP